VGGGVLRLPVGELLGGLARFVDDGLGFERGPAEDILAVLLRRLVFISAASLRPSSIFVVRSSILASTGLMPQR